MIKISLCESEAVLSLKNFRKDLYIANCKIFQKMKSGIYFTAENVVKWTLNVKY
jgi:hypothetical protein